MRVFLTGATGFIGSFLVVELLSAGHQVLGLTRSKAGVDSLNHAGAEALLGDVNDLSLLRLATKHADGVIHAAFNHSIGNVRESSENDGKVITTLGESLDGSGRPLLVTSGTGLVRREKADEPARESDEPFTSAEFPRACSEEAARCQTGRGGRVVTIRLPQVHNTRKQGRLTWHIQLAHEKGRVAYVDQGTNRVAAVHVSDAVRVYRLALEKGEDGARYHAVAEQGIPLRVSPRRSENVFSCRLYLSRRNKRRTILGGWRS